MGSTTSCCVSSSPKLRRNAHSRLESYNTEPELSREDTGCNLQHISDRENVDVYENMWNSTHAAPWSTHYYKRDRGSHQQRTKQCAQEEEVSWTWEEILDGKGSWTWEEILVDRIAFLGGSRLGA
uniref:Uncharacterized protein n=1 Tax=Oncorhynchus tshawytscha TaxID=74940 RepID=A0AAZ3RP61_ONCTS